MRRRFWSSSRGAFRPIPTVALVTRRAPGTAEALLRLGATGVRQVVDATDASGWRRLREVLGGPPGERAQAILGPVLEELGAIPVGARRFWEELVRSAPDRTTVRQLADQLKVTAVDDRVALRAGRSAESQGPPGGGATVPRRATLRRRRPVGVGCGVPAAVREPQSFGRHLRIVLGITPSEFRARYPFCTVLDRFVERLVRPYVGIWRKFLPLAPGKG